jgi:hypothetical protein
VVPHQRRKRSPTRAAANSAAKQGVRVIAIDAFPPARHGSQRGPPSRHGKPRPKKADTGRMFDAGAEELHRRLLAEGADGSQVATLQRLGRSTPTRSRAWRWWRRCHPSAALGWRPASR